MDFTFKKYKELLISLKNKGYTFQTFEEFIENPNKKVVVLRHDVDRRSKHSIDLALIENSVSVKATYYFRIVEESNQPSVIEKVVSIGNEIGYHYEDLGDFRGDYERAYDSFLKNLIYFRSFYPVKTISMHGSPANRIDNRDLWNKYDYKKNGIIAEPYFDVNYDEVFYITDAGRKWNDRTVSVRDKVKTKYEIEIKSIDQIIKLIQQDKLPKKLIINTHPHNWSNFGLLWIFIYVWQSIKNIVKFILIKYRKNE